MRFFGLFLYPHIIANIVFSTPKKPIFSKDFLENAHHGAFNADLDVRPTAIRRILSQIFTPEIHSTNIGQAVVNNLKFSVITEIESVTAS